MPEGPIETYRTPVAPDWIDYNGHMNVAYYMLVFDRGSDGLFDLLDLGAAYRRATDRTIYVLEAHLTYERELRLGDEVVVASRIVGADAKRLRIFHEMRHAAAGYLAATNELMCLHVDLAGPRAAPFPDDAAGRIGKLLARHAALPAPPQLGRSIRLAPRPSPAGAGG